MNSHLLTLIALFVIGLILFFLVAVAYRWFMNTVMGKYVAGYTKGGFLSFLKPK